MSAASEKKASESLLEGSFAQDCGNIIALEHVNLHIPSLEKALVFYVEGLGLTVDPLRPGSTRVTWINIGRTQLHLPLVSEERAAKTGQPRAQRVRGRIGIVFPDVEEVAGSLAAVAKRGELSGTKFCFSRRAGDPDVIDVVGPFGNVFVAIQANSKRHGAMARAHGNLGISFVEMDIPRSKDGRLAKALAKFYGPQGFDAPVQVIEHDRGATGARAAPSRAVLVRCGPFSWLRFREVGEKEAAPAAYDGHHVAIYVAAFGKTFTRLKGSLHTEHEHSDQVSNLKDALQFAQFRVKDVKAGAEVLYELEHEVRSLQHPGFLRALVNRKVRIEQ